MSKSVKLAKALELRFKGRVQGCTVSYGEVTVTVEPQQLTAVCRVLRDDDAFKFEQLIDLCGIDYLHYGLELEPGEDESLPQPNGDTPRYAVVYHLLSVSRNERLRVKTLLDGEPPRLDSVADIWAVANWFEREAFDLYGIVFDGHPDLRRILSDYGFIGHPFRKDFPIIGNVEMRYDPEQARVVYQPVSIETRVGTARVIREDFRYESGDAPPEAGHAE